MKFKDLLDIKPKVRLCDIIQLFLLGYDDKIYFDIYGVHNNLLFKEIRIIDTRLEKFYENEIEFIAEPDVESNSIFELYIYE